MCISVVDSFPQSPFPGQLLHHILLVAGVKLASFPGLRGGEGRPGTHARNYCEIYVREQWACTQNVIINCV